MSAVKVMVPFEEIGGRVEYDATSNSFTFALDDTLLVAEGLIAIGKSLQQSYGGFYDDTLAPTAQATSLKK